MAPEDIETINRLKPDFAGFIINFPKSHRSLSPEKAAALTKSLDESIKSIGVFVDQPEELVVSMLQNGDIDMAQLHGHESPEYISFIQRKTGKPVIKAFLVKDKIALEDALNSPADEILLDAGYGKGEVFDWSLLDPLTEAENGRMFFLAGGLNAENISEAIRNINPYAVDISSGVETDKRKDPEKIRTIINLIRNMEGR